MDSTIHTVVNKIAELIRAGYLRLLEVDNQVEDLSRRLELLMVQINTAEERNIIVHRELASVWVNQIRRPVFDAEDIIEEYCHEILTSSSLSGRKKGRPWIPCFPFVVKEAPLRHRLAGRIQGVLRQLDLIESNSCLVNVPSGSTPGEMIHDRTTYAEPADIWTGDIVVGNYKDSVTKSLLMDSGKREHIVLIMGHSGIGKTIVARQVYRAREVKIHFDVCAWVCLPPESHMNRYLDEIHRQVKEQTHCYVSDKEDVSQMLATMRYLVVLDGMDRTIDLKSILRELPRGAKGSRILVTTNLGHEEIEDGIPDIKDTVHMEPLERPDCLKLFWTLVSKGCPHANYRIYEEMIYMFSQGNPLAIRLLAGILYHKDHVKQWDEVFMLLESTEPSLRLLDRILTVSYLTLPRKVKLCFLYLGAMPPKVELDCKRLVRMWSAEGICDVFEDQQDLYLFRKRKQGPLYFTAGLLYRGLVQQEAVDCTGLQSYSIHEKVHQFAKGMAKKTSFLHSSKQFYNPGIVAESEYVRRLSIHNYTDKQVHIDISFKKLRTLLGKFVEVCDDQAPSPAASSSTNTTIHEQSWHNRQKMGTERPSFRQKFLRESTFLRVLDLEGFKIGSLLDSIGDMIHLRYLGLRNCGLKELPPSMAKLLNLETMDITGNPIETIVDEFWEIQGLNHVLAQNLSLPASMGVLLKLIILHGVIASPLWMLHNCPLSNMKNLSSLEILVMDTTVAQVVGEALINLYHLEHLRLAGISISIDPRILPGLRALISLELDGRLMFENGHAEEPPRFVLPPALKRLILRSSYISGELLNNLLSESNINQLELLDNSFIGPNLSFHEDSLRCLKNLKIGDLENLEDLVIKESATPKLKSMEIFGCPNLMRIQGLMNLDNLDDVLLHEMPEIFAKIEAEDVDKKLCVKIKHVRSVA